MKIIDVCDNVAGAGGIKQYYVKNNIDNYNIIPLMIGLAMGDLKNHFDFLLSTYQHDGYFFDYNEYVDDLLKSIDKDTIVRVWSSRNNSSDYLLLLYICNLIKDKCSIHVVFVSDLDERIQISLIDYKIIPELLEKEKVLTMDEVNKYIEEWNKELEINSDIRVMENGIIEHKSFSDYDDIILDYLDKLGRCKIGNLLEQLINNHVINNFDTTFYEYLINILIQNNKIRIVEKSDEYYSRNIIEKF